jgi:aminopeptidase N
VIALLLLALQQPSAVSARTDTLKVEHDALDYDIQLLLPDSGGHILGQVQTRWRIGSTEPIHVQLDTALRVVRVLMDGEAQTRLSRTLYGRDEGIVLIPHERHDGDTLTTMIRYHGFPHDGLVISTNGQGARTIFADNWPDRAHFWLPVQDTPLDKATATFHVEIPAGYQAIANGTLQRVDTLPRGRTVWHYRIAEPVPVYTFVVGVAHFAVTTLPDAGCAVRCVPLSLWTYPEDSAYAVGGPLRRVGDMIDYFSQLIGPFPFERLSHVESNTRYGGMENSTAIFYPEKAYGERKLSEETVAHETAHQWFGDAVTEADWHHVWLSEGFATYLSALWVGHADGDSAFRRTMREAAVDATTKNPVVGQPIVDPAIRNIDSVLSNNTYPKAAWALHSLRGLMGDSAFFGGLRDYYRRYRDSNALSSDFAEVMNQAAGTDLTWFFTQALTQPGYPKLEVSWRWQKKRLALVVRQTQAEAWGLFRLPGLVVRIDGVDHRIAVDGRETTVTIEGLKQRPATVVVDPDGWWLVTSDVGEGK